MATLGIVWLLAVTVISIASLVISVRLTLRQNRQPLPIADPMRSSFPHQGYAAPPQAYGTPDQFQTRPAYPQPPSAPSPPMQWQPRSRCADLNVTD